MKLYIIAIGLIAVATAGCGVRPYKAAGTKGDNKIVSPGYFLEGYRDAKVGEGEYRVEYLVSGGYTDPIPTSMQYALRRAGELCPAGFTHTFKKINMPDAWFEEFRCRANGCLYQPMVSGVVKCK